MVGKACAAERHIAAQFTEPQWPLASRARRRMDRGAGERHSGEGVTMAENTGAVKFEGQPPFLLPEAKSAQADLFERSVVVTLYSEVEGQGPGLASIVAQM